MSRAVADLTVVIPVYNRADALKRCLDSVAAQTVAPRRVIVVDDGSDDGSADVALHHPVGVTAVRGEHRGAAAARNLGLDAVDTAWTMFFDSDDIMMTEHIETAFRALRGRDADLVGWDITHIGLDGSTRVLPFEPDDIDWHNIMHGALATQRYMARTTLFRNAGGWNAEVRVWNDIELGVRLLAQRPRIVRADGNNVRQYETAVSITGVTWSGNIGRYDKAFEAMAASLPSDRRPWLDLKKAILAADIARENPAAGREMFAAIERPTVAVRAAYHYRRLGGRGAARLLRKFFSK